MEAGVDKDVIRALLESGLQYVTAPSAPCVCLTPFISITTITSHVPYAAVYPCSKGLKYPDHQ